VSALTDSYDAYVRYNIDTKVEANKPPTSARPEEFADLILAAFRSANKLDRVKIQSFDWRTLPMMRQLELSIPLLALWDETTWTPDLPWLNGVNPAVRRSDIGALMVGAKQTLTQVWTPTQIHRDNRGVIPVISDQVSYERLVQRAFEKIRQASRGMPAVMIRQLDALTTIMEQTTDPKRGQVQTDQAAMIHHASAESVPDESDRADVDT